MHIIALSTSVFMGFRNCNKVFFFWYFFDLLTASIFFTLENIAKINIPRDALNEKCGFKFYSIGTLRENTQKNVETGDGGQPRCPRSCVHTKWLL